MARPMEFEFEITLSYTLTKTVKVLAENLHEAEAEADDIAGSVLDDYAPKEQDGWELDEVSYDFDLTDP